MDRGGEGMEEEEKGCRFLPLTPSPGKHNFHIQYWLLLSLFYGSGNEGNVNGFLKAIEVSVMILGVKS